MERVIVRGTNWVGDVVMSLPFYTGLKAAWPQAEICVLTRPHLADLYRHNPCLSVVVELEERPRLSGWARGLRQVRELECEGAVCLPHSISAALFLRLAGIPIRCGRACHGRTPLFSHPVPGDIEGYDGHQTDFYLELLQALTGHAPGGGEPALCITSAERERAASLLQGLEGPVLGLFASAAYGPAKMWPREYFVELARTFLRDGGGGVVLFGGRSDRDLNAAIVEAIGPQARYLAGKTGLLESAACMERCRAVVANDSGPMHLAAATGVKTLGIFGSTDPRRTAPRGPQARYLSASEACAPCMQRTCRYATYACLRAITPDMVYAEIMR